MLFVCCGCLCRCVTSFLVQVLHPGINDRQGCKPDRELPLHTWPLQGHCQQPQGLLCHADQQVQTQLCEVAEQRCAGRLHLHWRPGHLQHYRPQPLSTHVLLLLFAYADADEDPAVMVLLTKALQHLFACQHSPAVAQVAMQGAKASDRHWGAAVANSQWCTVVLSLSLPDQQRFDLQLCVARLCSMAALFCRLQSLEVIYCGC